MKQDDAVIEKSFNWLWMSRAQENTTIPLLEKKREVNKKLDNLMTSSPPACTAAT